MKKYIFCLLHFFIIGARAEVLKIDVTNSQQQKMKLMIGIVRPVPQLSEVASLIKDDLSCYAQKKTGFNVLLKSFDTIPNKLALNSFYRDGYSIIIFITQSPDNSIEWRIYDSLKAVMTIGKKSSMSRSLSALAHDMADKIWFQLTGAEGIFSTYIAYCKEHVHSKHFFKDIYIQHPNSSKRLALVKKGKLFAPRWNKDSKHPRLLYSEATPLNVRLMMTTLDGSRSIVSDLDGLNMLPSFSADGTQIVYCFTRNGKSQLYYCWLDFETKRSYMRQITQNYGNNISPNLLENGDIVFCSDFETKSPQIYYYYAHNRSFERLTKGGYCVSPVICQRVNKIAYCKMINGISQLFTYDIGTQNHKQITFDNAKKDECSWSPCGTYLSFALEKGSQKRIAVLNLITNEQFYLTKSGEQCSYPSWSPRYVMTV